METTDDPKQISSPHQSLLAIVIGATALIVWLIYYYTRPLANVVNAIDNSNSNLRFTKQSSQVCEQIKEKVIDGDLFAGIGFSDESAITRNTTYDENRTILDCNKITTKPLGLGKKDGTDLIGVLKQVKLLETRLRAEGNKRPLLLFLTINAAEPAHGQKAFDPKVVKQLLQQITKNGYVAIIGSEIQLQNVLSKELVDMPRVTLCPFVDAQQCAVDWGFEKVRKYPWQ